MELSKDVSLLILVPSPEDVCSCPGDGDIFSDNDRFLSIPVPVFEMSKYGLFVTVTVLGWYWQLIELSSINKVSLVEVSSCSNTGSIRMPLTFLGFLGLLDIWEEQFKTDRTIRYKGNLFSLGFLLWRHWTNKE